MARNTMYRFRVELEGGSQKMWRRFEVSEKHICKMRISSATYMNMT